MEIDLSKYVTAYGGHWFRGTSGLQLRGYKLGQELAANFAIKEKGGELIELVVPHAFTVAEDKFLAGLLRPLYRKQSLDECARLITSKNEMMTRSLELFFDSERVRLAERAVKKAQKEKEGDWASPAQFLVPDIGTVVRLKKDFTFRLHYERRNDALLKFIGEEFDYTRTWNYDAKGLSQNVDVGPFEVTLKAGAVLKVSRIYIRQGGSDMKKFSSLTFNAQKGGVVVYNGKETPLAKKGARFWVKLRDVNQMVVEVDRATLADN